MKLDIRPSVQFVAVEMENKLRENDMKPPWENPDIPLWRFYERTVEELKELKEAMKDYSEAPTPEHIEAIIKEGADVCNFVHFIITKVCRTTREFHRGRPVKNEQ